VGHGSTAAEKGNEAVKGLVPRYSYLVDDLRASAAKALEERPGVPLFLGGHSMGGLIATLAALGDDDHDKTTETAKRSSNLLPRLSGLFLSSPALDVEWTPILRIQAPIGGLLSALVPKLRCVPAVDPKHLCRDPVVVEGYRRDPLNFVGNVRARTANELLRGFKAVAPLAPRLHGKSVPALVIFGGKDKIASLPAARRFVDAANGVKREGEEPCAELVVFPDAFHELFFGPDKEEAIGKVLAWIKKNSSAGKSVAKM